MFKRGGRVRRRPRAAVVAGGDPRRGREIGEYLRARGTLPRQLMVVESVGEHHVDGELCSGGRRLGWSRGSSERAAEVKLKRGLGSWWLERVTDRVWAPEMASPERIVVEAEADRGGRS